MTSSFFFKIGIMCWLISAKVARLKPCTFTKRFLLSLFSLIPVITVSHYNEGTRRPRKLNFLGRWVTYCQIFIRNFTACCFLKKYQLAIAFVVCSQLSVRWFYWSLPVCLHRHLLSVSHLTTCCIKQSPADCRIFSLYLDGTVSGTKSLS